MANANKLLPSERAVGDFEHVLPRRRDQYRWRERAGDAGEVLAEKHLSVLREALAQSKAFTEKRSDQAADEEPTAD